jgi:hypothetical protein
MSRASVYRLRKLEVTVMFEPNRMTSTLLQSAYLHVAPVLRKPLDLRLGPVPPTPHEESNAGERSAP